MNDDGLGVSQDDAETVREYRLAADRGVAGARHNLYHGRRIMKKIWLLAILLGVWPGAGMAQTTDELINDGQNTDNVLTQSMGYDRKSFSPLDQINRSNITRLVPIWNTSLMNNLGELAAPVVYNGVMYVINGAWTFAIDVETGRQIWRTPVTLEPRDAACLFQ